MNRMARFRMVSFLGFWILSIAVVGFASFEEDPIRKTQTKVVPVTEELLKREGEPGPASPSFKMADTSGFLVKEPYDQVEEEKRESELKEDDSSILEDDWFSWKEEADSSFSSEPIENK